ncbi:N-acetylmuramidase domain-containing protein [Paraburkholderia kururiensis]|uniref:N-acetylmuramidase domain-containing protein n=1 Tax=Paraburkholderia kururiensis TaxID=984307 RepID=UPI00037E658F|nr:N-acetylmuramidase domain-containing protein [Paraburkholderia kururiensis]
MSDEFVSHGIALDAEGMSQALDVLKVGATELWSVLSVETSGIGFFPDRRPKILYEQHVFSRLTAHRYDTSNADISHPKPGNYGATGSHQYDRLFAAIKLDREAALQSTSWGLGQTMGFNFADTGASSVEDMVNRMIHAENDQLLCTANQMANSGEVKALRARDWTSFARSYNGPNFAMNNYDSRLRAAFSSFSFGGTPDLKVRAAQIYLIYLDYFPGTVDGILGKRTRDAMNLFQAKEAIRETMSLDDGTLARLVLRVNALPL